MKQIPSDAIENRALLIAYASNAFRLEDRRRFLIAGRLPACARASENSDHECCSSCLLRFCNCHVSRLLWDGVPIAARIFRMHTQIRQLPLPNSPLLCHAPFG
jgi:hypothetical protein